MPLRISTGKWQYRFKVSGVPFEKVTAWAATEENRSRAEAEEKRHRDSILRGDVTATAKKTGRRFNEISEELERSLEFARIKASSAERIKASMVSLRVWFGDLDIGKIRAREIEAYKTWRLRGDQEIGAVKPVTVRHDLFALSKFYGWAIRMEIVTVNPVKDVEKPTDPDGEIRMHILTPAEEMDYFDRCAKAGYRNLADVARLMLEQGMRPEEAMSLERRAVDLERGRIQIFRGKTKAARRTLKMTAASREILARRMWETDSPWLFPSPKVETRANQPITKPNVPHDKVCASREINGDEPARPQLEFVLYDFRHTYATQRAERGMPLPTLAAILGHSSLRMVERYVHPTQDHMDAETVRIDALMRAERQGQKAAENLVENYAAKPN
jgi:integrase